MEAITTTITASNMLEYVTITKLEGVEHGYYYCLPDIEFIHFLDSSV